MKRIKDWLSCGNDRVRSKVPAPCSSTSGGKLATLFSRDEDYFIAVIVVVIQFPYSNTAVSKLLSLQILLLCDGSGSPALLSRNQGVI